MRLRARRGVALAIAIFALVAVAALVHATVAPTIAHRRAATRLVAFQNAESSAERGIIAVLREWTPGRWRELPVGSVVGSGTEPPAPGDPAVTSVRVARLSPTVFMIHSSAIALAGDVPAVARRILFLELRSPPVDAVPALTLGGVLTAGAEDVIATTDGCSTDSAGVPAVMVAPWSSVSWPGGAAGSSVSRDSAAGRAVTYERPAGLDVDALAARADVRLPGGSVVAPMPMAEDGRCAIAEAHWGEPLRSGSDVVVGCTSAHPVITAAGDLRLAGGRGQGVLLVTGRLRITGPLQFSGLIVASGGIETDGDEVSIDGAVYAGPESDATLRAARSTIRRSACVLRELASAHAVLAPIPERAWGR